jgi:hypothetical protein
MIWAVTLVNDDETGVHLQNEGEGDASGEGGEAEGEQDDSAGAAGSEGFDQEADDGQGDEHKREPIHISAVDQDDNRSQLDTA